MCRKILEKFLLALTASRLSIAAPILLTAVFWVLSSIPGELYPDDPLPYRLFVWLPPNIQNLLHIPAYALLGALWMLSLKAWRASSLAGLVLSTSLATGYGVVDEWHQSFVFGRYASATDALLNVIGALLGVGLAWRWLGQAHLR